MASGLWHLNSSRKRNGTGDATIGTVAAKSSLLQLGFADYLYAYIIIIIIKRANIK